MSQGPEFVFGRDATQDFFAIDEMGRIRALTTETRETMWDKIAQLEQRLANMQQSIDNLVVSHRETQETLKTLWYAPGMPGAQEAVAAARQHAQENDK